MGHDVTELPIGSHSTARADLKECDGLIVVGPEHIDLQIQQLYPRWHLLDAPKVGWFVETVEREDYGRQPIERILKLCDSTLCAGIQDEKYGMKWLPFGADTEHFYYRPTVKKYDAAFIGMVYGKRQEFLQRLTPHLKGINFTVGSVAIQDLSGIDAKKTVELYAENIRQAKVFVNLPHLSQLAVTKIWEVLACGTYLLTPTVPDMRNFPNFYGSGEFYDPDNPAQLAKMIREAVKNEESSERFLIESSESFKREHSNVQRAEVLLGAVSNLASARRTDGVGVA